MVAFLTGEKLTNAFGDFVSKLSDKHDLSFSQNHFTEYAKSLGFSKFAYYITPKRPDPDKKKAYLTTYPSEWVDLYLVNRFEKVDPVLLTSPTMYTPFQWSKTLPPTEFTKSQKKFFSAASDMGLADGITIPIRAFGGEFTTISFVPDRENLSDLDGMFREYQNHLHLIALQFHLLVRKMVVERATLDEIPPITAREREILLWVAKGKTSWEISLILGLAESTVIFHIEKVKRKLGVVSRMHAVILLMMHGLLEP